MGLDGVKFCVYRSALACPHSLSFFIHYFWLIMVSSSLPLEEHRLGTRAIKPTVSVIVPVYNGGESFRRCLESLQAQQTPFHELIVVADGDTDGSWQVAQTVATKTIRLAYPHGPACARNVGAKVAQGDLIFFVDADVTLAPDALSKVHTLFDADPDLAAVIGSYDDAPGASNFLSQYRNLLHHFVHQTASEEACTFWGACGIIRRQVFLELGGFDERYRRPCIEDIELGYRLKRKGYSMRLYKDLQVKHLKYWDAFSIVKTDVFCRALPWTILLLQQRHIPNDLNLRLSSRVSVALCYSLVGVLLGALWIPQLLLLALALSVMLFCINVPVYQFFHRKRGFGFALKVIPWHWLYYLYSGLAFMLGALYVWLRPGKLIWNAD